MAKIVRKWWKEGTAYQIWPASYKDSNGDGIGDLPGIIETLDQLKELGVDILWVSPAYASPKKDMGYDISNYEDIDPQFGTLADAERLIKECHARGIRLLFDLVINHTSDQHPWFQESRRSRDSPKRDWYIWRPARHDVAGRRQPPNNWRSMFGGSAWQWDEGSQEYYLHLFVAEQPDLNWENAATRQAIYASALKFWLDKGLDGFRIDTANLYSKPTTFVDAPIHEPDQEFQLDADAWCNGPRMHEFLQEMHAATLQHYDVMTVGELGQAPNMAAVLKYVSAAERQMDMVFQFNVTNIGRDVKGDNLKPIPFTLSEFKHEYALNQEIAADPSNDGWGTAFLENHDLPRSISRFATDTGAFRARAAKLLALLLVASSGTLFLYQGQEIGIKNAPKEWGPENYPDVAIQNHLANLRAKNPGNEEAAVKEAMVGIAQLARDHARAPIPWTSQAPTAGFSPPDASAPPWMPLHPDFAAGWNMHDQQTDPQSVRSFYKEALKVRKARPGACIYGTFRVCDVGGDHLFVFEKVDVGKFDQGPSKLVGVLNFTDQRRRLETEKGTVLGQVLVGNVEADQRDAEQLEPWEGRLYEAS